MKTAISIPDEVFDEAERLARRTKRSRSEIYTRALAEYLARHVDDQVTERMNETLRDLGIEEDAFVSAASRRIDPGPGGVVTGQGEVWWRVNR